MASDLKCISFCILAAVIWMQVGVDGINLQFRGIYRPNNCNVTVKCYDGESYIKWSIEGDFIPTTDIKKIPGFTFGPLAGTNSRLHQILRIGKYYDEITITCDSRRSLATLSIWDGGYTITTETKRRSLLVGEIVGIIIGGVAIVGGLIAIIFVCVRRKKRTQGRIIHDFNNPINRKY